VDRLLVGEKKGKRGGYHPGRRKEDGPQGGPQRRAFFAEKRRNSWRAIKRGFRGKGEKKKKEGRWAVLLIKKIRMATANEDSYVKAREKKKGRGWNCPPPVKLGGGRNSGGSRVFHPTSKRRGDR